jgi:carboxymethylenebutenolidase
MDQRLITLYDAYTHGALGRRELAVRLEALGDAAPGVEALLAALRNDYGRLAKVEENDPRLTTQTVHFEVGPAKVGGYLARLRGGTKRPAVLVVHENRGLNPHIRDVARRFAVEGFLALAVDALSPTGGTPVDEDEARERIGALDPEETLAHFAAAVPWLSTHPESTGRVGAVGFCWGGALVNRLAAAGTKLRAGVAYYGRALPDAEVPRITAPLLLHYAGLDDRINAGMAGYEAALKAGAKRYEQHVYEGAQHAFNNDTSPARYHPEAAALAWGRTIAFLQASLGPREEEKRP